jgi:hypothetical protein
MNNLYLSLRSITSFAEWINKRDKIHTEPGYIGHVQQR